MDGLIRKVRAAAAALTQLSGRERQVVLRVADGLTNKAVAGELGISAKTVEKYRRAAVDKTGTRTTVGLVKLIALAELTADLPDHSISPPDSAIRDSIVA